jgi:transcriptional regulator with XRE-family HTH domain
MMALETRVFTWMKEQGMTLADLSRVTGYKESSLKQLRYGNVPISEGFRNAVVAGLGPWAAGLFTETPGPTGVNRGLKTDLFAWAKAQGMTLEELGEKVGYRAGTLSMIQRGHRPVTRRLRNAVVARLGPEMAAHFWEN